MRKEENQALILFSAATAGALLLAWRRRSSSAPAGEAGQLGPPIETATPYNVTPHGHFGAPRSGPPVHVHQGVDLAAAPGSSVLAVGDGRLISNLPGLGKVVLKLELDRPGRWSGDAGPLVTHIVYADLGQTLARPGERVRRGQPIARVWPHGFVHVAAKQRTSGREEFFDPAAAGLSYQRSDAGAVLLARNARTPVRAIVAGDLTSAEIIRALRPWRPPRSPDDEIADWLQALKGRGGVYAIRDAASKEILYVGESHRSRLYKTLIRHFYAWSGRGSGPSYRPERVEAAVVVLDDPDAIAELQFRLIQQLQPRDNVQDGHTLIPPHELEDAPF